MKEYEEQIEIMKALKDKVDAVEGKKWEDGVGYVQLKTAHPDPKLHKYISFAKSGPRIIAAYNLSFGTLFLAGIFFAVAEILGIIEEMV